MPSANPNLPTLSRDTYQAFAQLVYEQCGINLGPQKEALVSSRVGKRIRQLGLPDHQAYLEFVRADKGEEMVHLLDSISTNVTSFFRENHHFEVVRSLMTDWAAAGQHRFRLWSAACSTGEEPLTLAMVLGELPELKHCDWRILATDISTKALRLAQAGIYQKDKLQHIPPALRQRYFSRQPDGSYRVDPLLHQRIIWRRTNLSKPPFALKGGLDLVLCRNVMIYFDAPTRERLVNEIYRLLKPEGCLIIGAAETLSGLQTRYRCIRPSAYLK